VNLYFDKVKHCLEVIIRKSTTKQKTFKGVELLNKHVAFSRILKAGKIDLFSTTQFRADGFLTNLILIDGFSGVGEGTLSLKFSLSME